MSKIQILDVKLEGVELFNDSETFFNELEDSQLDQIVGGLDQTFIKFSELEIDLSSLSKLIKEEIETNEHGIIVNNDPIVNDLIVRNFQGESRSHLWQTSVVY